MTDLQELAAREKRDYQRRWRAANKDKVKETNRRYWLKKAAERVKQDAEDKANL